MPNEQQTGNESGSLVRKAVESLGFAFHDEEEMLSMPKPPAPDMNYIAKTIGVKKTPVTSEDRSGFSTGQVEFVSFLEGLHKRVHTATEQDSTSPRSRKLTRLEDVWTTPAHSVRDETLKPVSNYSPADFYARTNLKQDKDAHGNPLKKPITIPNLGERVAEVYKPKSDSPVLNHVGPQEPSIAQKWFKRFKWGAGIVAVGSIATMSWLVYDDEARNKYSKMDQRTVAPSRYAVENAYGSARADRPNP